MPLAGAAGLALLVYLVAELGPSRIAAQLQGLGSILPLVLLITAAKYPLQAAGWRLVLAPSDRPSWGSSIAATITGDALGYLTWAGPFAGEPIRAFLIRDSVSVAAGTAAGAVERTIYNLTAAGLVWVVLFVLVSATHTIALVAAVAASVLIAVALLHHVRRNIRPWRVADTRPNLRKPAATEARRASRTAEFFHAARQLWRERRGVLPVVALLCLVQHAVLIGEAYVILSALDPGASLHTALVFEAVSKIVNTAGLVVPGRLGIAEGGSALLADALGFAASHGLSLTLMRRVRALVWAGVGLVLLPSREARARRPR
jgi:uncharacterized protein (TIRG00374 family)